MDKFHSHTYTQLGEDVSRLELLPIDSQLKPIQQHLNQRSGDTAESAESPEEPLLDRKPAIKGWPETPKHLKSRSWKGATLASNTAIALIPLVFICLSIWTLHLSGAPISTGGQQVKSATRLGPTLFPIIFAAIVGRSLKALASYHAEQGTKLGTLEQMMGSLTIFGAIELQVLLRTFDFFGVSLIMLWALSPLGGQASLRLLDIGVRSNFTNSTIKYLDSDSSSMFEQGGVAYSEVGFLSNALYLSALLTPPAGQAASVDTWGNVKIPTIENLEQTSSADDHGWLTVSSENISYSSLVGLPIAGVPKTGNSSFNVEFSYMVLSCQNLSAGTVPGATDGAFSLNFTNGSLSSYLLPYQEPYPDVEPQNLTFVSGTSMSDLAFIAQCVSTRSSIGSNVTCKAGSCAVSRIRRSKFDLRPSGYIGLPAKIFSDRFSLLFNTYYQCSLVPWFQTGNLPSDLALLNGSTFWDIWGVFNATNATTRIDTNVYICNKMWAAILLLVSAILLLCGIYSTVVKHMTRGPQILGYVSTMTRDNPYINLPSEGCTLDDLQRTRLLKDLKVKLRDVAPQDEVGHIALSDAASSKPGRLAPSRIYGGPVSKVKAKTE